MFYPFNRFAPAASLRSIASPNGSNDLGHYFLPVVSLLIEGPAIEEVREVCITAIENGDFQNRCFKAFQSNVKDLSQNHVLVQRTIIALSYDHAEVAVKLIRHYLKFSYAAYHEDVRHKEKIGALPSAVMHRRATRFVMRLFFLTNPKFLSLSKLECNSFFNESSLLGLLLELTHDDQFDEQEELLFFNGLTLRLKRLAQKASGYGKLDEKIWSLFEQTYRYACAPRYSVPHFGMKRLQYIADLVLKGTVSFQQDDDVFDGVLASRAQHICKEFLRRYV
jgi:hypothetical protein